MAPPASADSSAAALLDELLEEVLLRFPPDDPKRLVHAALVCIATVDLSSLCLWPRAGWEFLPVSTRRRMVRNALHFVFRHSKSLFKYDLGTREMSVIDLPFACFFGRVVLMTAEDGGLGLANMFNYKLSLWSRAVGPGLGSITPDDDLNAGWKETRVVELKTLLPDDAISNSLDVAGFADGVRVIFLRTDDGLFTVDLMSYHVAKVFNGGWYNGNFPYMSFCTPDIGSCLY
ncbi:hypothetical protein ACP70R_015126 [Stipagrostis hirtigluma subsp. patula]